MSNPDEGTGGKVVAWSLYLVQLLYELILFIFLIASVMASDGCGTGVLEPRICSGMYFALIFYGFALVLLVAAIAVPVLIVRATGGRWLRPLVGIVALTILAIVYVVLVSL